MPSPQSDKVQIIHQVSHSVTYSVFPPAELLAEYEKIEPGSAGRILAMAETQMKHRQTLEKSKIASINRLQLLGVIAGFVLSVLVLLCACYVALHGYERLAITMVSTTVLFVLVVFVLRRQPWTRNKK